MSFPSPAESAIVPFMADDTLRRDALQFALEISDQCEEMFCDDLDDAVEKTLDAAEKIFQWLSQGIATELVMHVGPVTEQH